MASPLIEELPHSPSLSPAWRWARAGSLYGAGAAPDPRRDDRWVARALRHHRRRDAAVAAARDLAEGEDPTRRWRLEADLLTAEPQCRVARRQALPPSVVAAYHALFFCVRDRPAARDWLAVHAVGCGPWNDFAGPQPGGVWKFAAFAGGVALLDATVAITTGGPLPGWARGTADAERRLRLLGMLTVRLLAARSDGEARALAAIRGGLDRPDGPAAAPARPRRRSVAPRSSAAREAVPGGGCDPGASAVAREPRRTAVADEVGRRSGG